MPSMPNDRRFQREEATVGFHDNGVSPSLDSLSRLLVAR